MGEPSPTLSPPPLSPENSPDEDDDLMLDDAGETNTTNDGINPAEEDEVEAMDEDEEEEDDEEEEEGEEDIEEIHEEEPEREPPPPQTRPPRKRAREPSTVSEVDTQSKKKEATTDLEAIEKEFEALKQEVFDDKIRNLESEIEQIKSGTHPMLLAQLGDVDEQAQERLWASDQWQKYQTDTIQVLVDHEKSVVEAECKAEKQGIKEKLLAKLSERKRKLLDEKQQTVLPDKGFQSRALRNKRSAVHLANAGQGASAFSAAPVARRKLAPAHVTYCLKEAEILEDLATIRKAIQMSNSGSSSSRPSQKGDVYVEKGILHFHGTLLEREKPVTVESSKTSSKWHGILSSINSNEITVLSVTDGKKDRFPISDFRTGKLHIHELHTF